MFLDYRCGLSTRFLLLIKILVLVESNLSPIVAVFTPTSPRNTGLVKRLVHGCVVGTMYTDADADAGVSLFHRRTPRLQLETQIVR